MRSARWDGLGVAPCWYETSPRTPCTVTPHRFVHLNSPSLFAFGTKKRWAIVGEAFAPRSSFFTSHSITRCIVAEIVIEFWNISMGERHIPKDMVLLCVRNVSTYRYCCWPDTGHFNTSWSYCARVCKKLRKCFINAWTFFANYESLFINRNFLK